MSIHRNRLGNKRRKHLHFKRAGKRHILISTLTFTYHKRLFITIADRTQLSHSIFGCIILIITIIFVQLELGSIASTGENRYCHLFVIAIQIHHIIQIHGQYGTCLYINRIFINGKRAFHNLIPFQQSTCMPFIPFSFRQPYTHLCIVILYRSSDRHNQHIISEHIFISELIGFLIFWIIIIHGAAE